MGTQEGLTELTKGVEESIRCCQQILRLEDWDIQYKLVARHEMDDYANYGQCQADRLDRVAVITLLGPMELKPQDRTGRFYQELILHELLHLYFREAGPKDWDEVEEFVVRKVCRVLGEILDLGERQIS